MGELTAIAGLAVAAAALTHASLGNVAPFPLALAFSAGALTTLNPCGFALLPAYVAYTLRGDSDAPHRVGRQVDHPGSDTWSQTLRGGLLGLPLTAGFLLVFSLFGVALALGGHALARLFPWLGLLVGIGLVALGGWMLLTRRTLEWSLPGRLAALAQPKRSGMSGWRGQLTAAWTFGLGYGLSSLGCALPIFLLVVGAAITAHDAGVTLLTLAAYAAGMALTILAVALSASALHDLMRRAVFPLLRWIQPLAALALLAAGVYIIQFQARSGLVFH